MAGACEAQIELSSLRGKVTGKILINFPSNYRGNSVGRCWPYSSACKTVRENWNKLQNQSRRAYSVARHKDFLPHSQRRRVETKSEGIVVTVVGIVAIEMSSGDQYI